MPDDCASEVDDEELYDECIYNFVKQSINGSTMSKSVNVMTPVDTFIFAAGLIFCVIAAITLLRTLKL